MENRMKDDQEFNLMFVRVVEKYEEVYNYKLEKYANRNVREVAWQKVAIELNCTAKECKKRWRMLRISLLRYLRQYNKSTESSGKKKKPFYLENAMKFLIPYTKSRHPTETADSDEDVVCENNSQIMDYQTICNYGESVNSSDFPQKKLEARNEESQEVDKVPTSSDWENLAVQYLTVLTNKHNANTIKKETDEEDSDLLFLKSLLPDLKKLSDPQKRRFKQRIFALYDDILNEDRTVTLNTIM